MPQLQKTPEEKAKSQKESRPKAGSASEEKIPVRLPNGDELPLSADEINQWYSSFQISRQEWLDLRRAHAESTPWPGEDPGALYKKKLDEALAAMQKHRAAEETGPLTSKTAIGRALEFGKQGAVTFGTRMFDTLNLLLALSGITALAEGMGTTATKTLMELGYDPQTADALGNTTEFAYAMMFPNTALMKRGQTVAKTAIEAAKLTKQERIARIAGRLDETLGEMGGTGETVAKGTAVAKAQTAPSKAAVEAANLPKLRTPLEEAQEAFNQHFKIIRDKVMEIRHRVTRSDIAQRAHEGVVKELPNTPEQEAMLRQALNPVMNALNDEYKRLIEKGVTEEDFIQFLAKLYPVMDAMPEYFGRMASAGRALGEFRDPTKITTEQMKRFFDVFGRMSDAPVNMENWRDWKDVVTDSIGPLFTGENPKALPRFLGAVGEHGIDSETIGAMMKLNMVSGPLTWVANLAGGTWTAATMIPKGILAAEHGKLLGDPARHTTMETSARILGMLEGIGLFTKAAYNKDPAFIEAITGHSTKLEGAMGSRGNGLFMNSIRFGGGVLAFLDQAVRIPIITGELAAAGVRAAIREGIESPKEVAKYVQKFIEKKGTPADLRAAHRLAEEAAATSSLGPWMQKIAQVRKVGDEAIGFASGGILPNLPLGTMAMPFIKSGQSLARTIWNDTPFLGAVSRTTQEALSSGDPVRAAEALGRMTFAQLLSTWAFGLAATGYVTGDGPTDPRLRAQWEATGWKPRTFTLPGGMSLDLKRLSPIGDILSFHANVYDMWRTGDLSEDNLEKSAQALAWTGVSLFSQVNYMDLFGEMIQFTDPGRPPTEAFQKGAVIAGNLIPYSGLLRHFSQIDFRGDKLQGTAMRLPLEENKDFLERMGSTVGGWGGRYRRNIFGEITRYQLPMHSSPEKDEDAEYLQSLGVTGLSPPDDRLFGRPAPGNEFTEGNDFSPAFRMSTEEADTYSEAKGRAFRQLLREFRSNPEFQKLSPVMQRSEIHKLYNSVSNDIALGELVKKHPTIVPDLEQFFTMKGQLLEGSITPQSFKQANQNRFILRNAELFQGEVVPSTQGGGAPQTEE